MNRHIVKLGESVQLKASISILVGRPFVFLTICTKDRKPWLTEKGVHDNLKVAWQSADAWLVGYYLIMPDHIHLFCAPRDLNMKIEAWVTYWKRQFRRLQNDSSLRWQTREFHHRLRRTDNYTEKWNYVRENPVRQQLVTDANLWSHQGMLNVLQW